MTKKLSSQLKNHSDIKNILRKKDVVIFLENDVKAEVSLFYLPYNFGSNDFTYLFEIIKQEILLNFAFKCSEVEGKLKDSDPEELERLLTRAVRRFSKHTAKGELGELILFTLIDVYLEAPKILSKLSFKTSRRVAVFGADAVHAQYVNDNLFIYFGESKLHKNFNGAAADAVTSIKSAREKFRDEFDLIESHLDFPDMTEHQMDDIMEFINPYSGNDHTEKILSPCFIGFVDEDTYQNSSNEHDFLNNYVEVAKKHTDNYFNKLVGQKLDIKQSSLLLLPFSSIDELVQQFIDYLGIEE
ncbi:DUF1837 domain-containing protein [Pectobacterium brasiliense]|uniref:HamA C-terminal domain-containing protein n=1 Tax=Pectobacterium TaxID=122277 RepID=UPI0015DEC997|nr:MULTISPECIES: DUF1837 domain-containing protein [Pectobacterium]MBA0203914.1 DUF1837 domain-containing protein [Pectobacterium aroidearum]MDY4324045.1 DUF1837 domain-containing protein [Pectobacterium brasiliense]